MIFAETDHVPLPPEGINTTPGELRVAQAQLLSISSTLVSTIPLQLSVNPSTCLPLLLSIFLHLLVLPVSLQLSVAPSVPPMPPMTTRKQNKSAHPGIPDMTPSQLLAVGLPPTTPRVSGKVKKLTKDQQIALLTEQLRASQGISSGEGPLHGSADLSTDEETEATVGAKRKAKRSAASTPRCAVFLLICFLSLMTYFQVEAVTSNRPV